MSSGAGAVCQARVGGQSSLPFLFGLLVVSVFSICKSGYEFGRDDDGLQSAFVTHRLEPDLFAEDILIQKVYPRYRSALFAVLTGVARLTGSTPTAYFVLFLCCRVLLIGAWFVFARSLLGDDRAAILSGLFLGTLGRSLGGVLDLEASLSPHVAALPFALLALGGTLARRAHLAFLALVTCLALHPVTGVNTFTLILLRQPLAANRLAWPQFFALSVGTLGTLAGICIWCGGLTAESSPLVMDVRWTQIVERTTGGFVFLVGNGAWVLTSFPGTLALAVLCLLGVQSPVVRRRVLEFAAAAFLACLVHVITVDFLRLHLMLQACPQRTTFVVTMCTYAMLGKIAADTMRTGGALGRVAALAAIVALTLRFDNRLHWLVGFALVVIQLDRHLRSKRWRIGLASAALVAGVVFGLSYPTPDTSVAAKLLAFKQTGRLTQRLLEGSGISAFLVHWQHLWVPPDDDWERLHRWLRLNTAPGEPIMPPINGFLARTLCRRPVVMNARMATYTHLSRPLAIAFDNWDTQVGRLLRSMTIAERSRAAQRQGAKWFIVDAEQCSPEPGDPAPIAQQGKYLIYRSGAER